MGREEGQRLVDLFTLIHPAKVTALSYSKHHTQSKMYVALVYVARSTADDDAGT
eukprot:COSAG01_NODE_71970_length_254_cov_0.722581_1_plen_54_part_00